MDQLRAVQVRAEQRDRRPERLSVLRLTAVPKNKKRRRTVGIIQVSTENHPAQFRDGTQRQRMGKKKATDVSLDELFDIWLTVGSKGVHWQECQAGEEETRKRLILRPYRNLDEDRLRALSSALRRWEAWVQESVRANARARARPANAGPQYLQLWG